MTEGNLFDRPVDEWTDTEIAVGLAVLGCEIEKAKAAGDTALAGAWTTLAIVLAEHRDARRALARAVDDAMSPVRVLWADLPDEPA